MLIMVADKSKEAPAKVEKATAKDDDDKLKQARKDLHREHKLEEEKPVTADDPDIIIEPTGEVSRNRPAEAAADISGLDPVLEEEKPVTADDPDIIIEPTGEISRDRAAERIAALTADDTKTDAKK